MKEKPMPILMPYDVDHKKFVYEKRRHFLFKAAREGDLTTLKGLLKYFAIDIWRGKTLLHESIEHQRLGIAKYLIQKGADVNKFDVVDATPLLKAAYAERINQQIVPLLIASGAEVNKKNKYGDTPLHLACENPRNRLGVIETLVENGADVNAKCKLGQTPFFRACLSGKADFALYLEQKGANVYEKDNKGWDPLRAFTIGQNLDFIRHLLRKYKLTPNYVKG